MLPTQNSNAHLSIRNRLKIAALGLAFALMAPLAGAQMEFGCGSLENNYGPWDYTNPQHFRDRLKIVEEYHFDSGVENLKGHARNPTRLAGDLDYTLRAFPNHHRALYTMIRYSLSEDPRHKKKMRYTPECYLRRAMMFQPADGKVRMLYGIYLSRTDKLEEATKEFQKAAVLMPDSPEAYYNIGLMQAKTGDYVGAREHAHKAYALGYPMEGLRNILKRAGQWEEPASE